MKKRRFGNRKRKKSVLRAALGIWLVCILATAAPMSVLAQVQGSESSEQESATAVQGSKVSEQESATAVQGSVSQEQENTSEEQDSASSMRENVPSEQEHAEAAGAGPAPVSVSAPSYVLMEASTGQIICAQNESQRLHPASITKIMTLLLIFEALDNGKIHLQDPVTTSAHAKSMGGSQVFLEEGEIQTVDTLIKCIAVASGNDAAVAMAEYIGGSEEAFVQMMNEKAKSLGMTQTSFVDCCGLSDSDAHMTTALDVALMSRELITRYPQVYNYTQIWMEDITHETRRGSSTFTLSSTNKLLKQYPYATGLKTGSTNAAKYCLSATAKKDGIDLIAVVMKAPDYKVRFQDAMTLLNYGFSLAHVYVDENQEAPGLVQVEGGIQDQVSLTYDGAFRYLDVAGQDLGAVTKELQLPEHVQAPVEKGEKAGEAVYYLNGTPIGSVDLLYGEDVEKAVYKDYVGKVLLKFCL